MLPYRQTNSNHLTKPSTAKNPYFQSRWGAQPALEKSIDRSMYEHHDTSPYTEMSDQVKEKILVSYKTGAPSEARSAFMRKLARESVEYLANQRGVRSLAIERQALLNQATASLVERIFDQLEAYSIELNQTVGWTELRITCTQPAFVTEVLKYSRYREPLETVTNFRARLSTRHVSLVIRGRDSIIELLTLPVEKVIGLSAAEAGYTPLVRIEAAMRQDQIEWSVQDKPLSEGRLETLVMEVFATLIETTKEASRSAQKA